MRALGLTKDDAGQPINLPPVYPLIGSLDQMYIDSLIASLEGSSHGVDSYLAHLASIDHDLDSLIAARIAIAHAVDAVLSTPDGEDFTIDGFIVPAPGALVVPGSASGSWTVPPGVTSVNAFLWGSGGLGASLTPLGHGGSGGGGGGFCYRLNITVLPGASHGYQVAPGGIVGDTHISFGAIALIAQNGQPGSDAGGGSGGGASGGDVNPPGGDGGDAWLLINTEYGAGGGSAAGPLGVGNAGQDAGLSSPGLGGAQVSGMGTGGQGGTILGTTNGLPGSFPGGGGGGQAYRNLVAQNQAAGGSGLLILTWNAGVHFVNSVVSQQVYDDFTIDSFLAGSGTVSHSVNALLAQYRSVTTAITALMAIKSSLSYSANALLATQKSMTYALDNLKAKAIVAAHATNSQIAVKSTASHAISSFIAASPTAVITAGTSGSYGLGAGTGLPSGNATVSMCFWVNFPSLAAAVQMVAFYGDGATAGKELYIGLRFNGVNNAWGIGNGATNIVGITIPVINTKYWVCGTLSNGAVNLYANNVLVATGTVLSTNILPTFAGIGGIGGGNNVNAKYKDFRIYNYVLSAGDRTSVYNSGTQTYNDGVTGGKVLWWRINEGGGSTLYDSISNNNCALTGVSWGTGP